MSSHQSLKISRRTLIKGTASALVLAPSLGILPLASAKDPIKTAGIYTVPVEQQWVSRIHKAALAAQSRGDIAYTFTENTANTDYPRVMREYAEQGNTLIIGEIFGAEAEAREDLSCFCLCTKNFSDDQCISLLRIFPHHSWVVGVGSCLLYTSPSPRDKRQSRMPSSA